MTSAFHFRSVCHEAGSFVSRRGAGDVLAEFIARPGVLIYRAAGIWLTV